MAPRNSPSKSSARSSATVCRPLIVVVDNDGYTVERAIRGAAAGYNDIAPWRWADLPHAFGADPADCTSVRVDTVGGLRAALDAATQHPDRLTFVQAVTGRLDVPPLLEAVARAAAAANTAPPAAKLPPQAHEPPPPGSSSRRPRRA